MEKIIIYKAIFGNYDKKPKSPPPELAKNITFVLISDNNLNINGWETVLIKNGNPIENNRHCKMFPWEYFKSESSIYLDGHIEFGKNFEKLYKFLSDKDYHFAVNRHRSKGNISDEFIRCVDNSKLTKKQIKKVLESDLIFDADSVECGMIYRNHNDLVKNHAKRWWWYFNNICPRDQLSIHSAAREVGLDVVILDTDFSNKDFFKIVGHKNWFLNLISMRIKILLRVLLKGTILKN